MNETQAAQITPVATIENPIIGPTISGNRSAVILLPPGEELNVRAAAGTGNPVLDTLPATTTDIVRTGPVAQVGDDLWAEIALPTTGTGWVSARYLTEYVPAATFCMDTKIQILLDDLEFALENKNGEFLASLVSPVHGLDLRYYRYGTVANYTAAEAAWVFQSTYVVNWGAEPGSGDAKEGTFSQVPAPILMQVFSGNYEKHCNDAQKVSAFSLGPWPEEYANVNYYLIYLPGVNPDYGGLDWRAWAVGVEYVGGKPYLFALIHFQWEP